MHQFRLARRSRLPEDAMQVRSRRRWCYSEPGCDIRHVAAFQHFLDQGGFGARQAKLLLQHLMPLARDVFGIADEDDRRLLMPSDPFDAMPQRDHR
jgi:hypothetical protein